MTDGPAPDTSVGAGLTRAREAAGLTVDQVSAQTRIRATLVRDLEADRFDSSGARVYARGHIRAIAGAIGVDAAPLLAAFDAAQGREPAPLEAIEPFAPRSPHGFSFREPQLCKMRSIAPNPISQGPQQ